MSAPTEITRDPLDWEPCCYRPISSTAADNKETTIFKKMFVCHLSETSLESFVCYRKRAWVMWIILVESWCQNAKAVSLPFPLFLIIPYILVWLFLIQIFMCNIKPERLFFFCQPYFFQFLNADQSPWLNDKIREKWAKSYILHLHWDTGSNYLRSFIGVAFSDAEKEIEKFTRCTYVAEKVAVKKKK